jgi:hypothetical protein
MKSIIRIAISVAVVIAVSAIWGQGPAGSPAGKEQAMAANRAKLMKYQWVSDTEVNVKGKTRKDVQAACRYGPDGKVVRMPVGSNSVPSLVLNNYYNPDDKVTIGFDQATQKLVSNDVNTYLGDPTSDVVTMTIEFASLPDGTNDLQRTVVNAQSKELPLTTTNPNYQPVGP